MARETEIKRIEIVLIEKYPKPKNGWYFYGKVLDLFGKKTIREFGIFWSHKVSDEEIKTNGLYVENGNVYTKPYALFHMVDGSSCRKNFDTIDEMENFIEKDVKSSYQTWIKL